MRLPPLLRTLPMRLFRWQSDGLQPIRLGQRRIFILPTAAGLQFAGLLVVMLLAAINYQLSLGHALVFLLAGLGLVGMVHTFRSLYGLEILPGRAPAVHAGATARFQLHLRDTRRQARPQLRLRLPGGDEILTSIAAEGGSDVDIPLPAVRRGWLELPRLQLESRYPLGLFRAWSYLQPAMRCLVYPRPVDTPLPPLAADNSHGGQPGGRGDEDFSGLRPRQPADALHHVAWKAAARDDGERPLLVKEFAGGGSARLCLDWAFTAAGNGSEARLSQLCGWVLAAENAGASYALHLPAGVGETGEVRTGYGHGAAHCRHCLTLLALARD